MTKYGQGSHNWGQSCEDSVLIILFVSSSSTSMSSRYEHTLSHSSTYGHLNSKQIWAEPYQITNQHKECNTVMCASCHGNKVNFWLCLTSWNCIIIFTHFLELLIILLGVGTICVVTLPGLSWLNEYHYVVRSKVHHATVNRDSRRVTFLLIKKARSVLWATNAALREKFSVVRN